jgi:hypothetical protein
MPAAADPCVSAHYRGHSGEMTHAGQDSGVLVTGATSGLGRAVALRFADQGTPVAVVGRDREALRQVTAEVQARDARAVPLHADLSDTAALPDLVERPQRPNSAASVGSSTQPQLTSHGVPRRVESRGCCELDRPLCVGALRHATHARRWRRTHRQHLLSGRPPRAVRMASGYASCIRARWPPTGERSIQNRGPAGPADFNTTEALDPTTVANLIVWMATAPDRPVLTRSPSHHCASTVGPKQRLLPAAPEARSPRSCSPTSTSAPSRSVRRAAPLGGHRPLDRLLGVGASKHVSGMP